MRKFIFVFRLAVVALLVFVGAPAFAQRQVHAEADAGKEGQP